MQEVKSDIMEFPTQQKPIDGKIIYPPGVKEITDKITNDEVVKRLKVSAAKGVLVTSM